jgi:hypothetical protein
MIVEVWFHPFLTSTLDGGEWSDSRLARFTLAEKNPRYTVNGSLGGLQKRSGLFFGGKRVAGKTLDKWLDYFHFFTVTFRIDLKTNPSGSRVDRSVELTSSFYQASRGT